MSHKTWIVVGDQLFDGERYISRREYEADRLADAVEALLTECSGEDCYPCSHMNALEAALAAYRETTK